MEKAISCYKKFADTFEHAREVFANAIQNELLQGLWFDAVCVPYYDGMLVIYILNIDGEGEEERKKVYDLLKNSGVEGVVEVCVIVYDCEYTTNYFPKYAKKANDVEKEE